MRKSVQQHPQQRIHDPASMGPQLYRCGNSALDWVETAPYRCFNGAATLSLRKYCEAKTCTFTSLLASMGLQLYRCRNCQIIGMQCILFRSLQWGRNFIVAEMVQDTIDTNSITLLQWGRNFIVAEMYQLQRCLMSARSSFNGAATLSLRKCLYSEKADVILKSLQWGRNFIVTEIVA